MSKYVEVSRYFHNECWTSISTKYEEKMSVRNEDLIELRDALNERIAELGLEDSPINKMSVSDEFKEFLMDFSPSCAPSRESVESVTVEVTERTISVDGNVLEAGFSNDSQISKDAHGWSFKSDIATHWCVITMDRSKWPQYAIDEIERIEREEAEREAVEDAPAVVWSEADMIVKLGNQNTVLIEAIKELRNQIMSLTASVNGVRPGDSYSVAFDWQVNLDGGDAS